MYRLRLAEKKRFTYKSAYLYEQIRKLNELQEEYLVVVKYDVKSFLDLFQLKQRLQRVDEELCKVQKEMYRDRALQKRSCKTEADMDLFEASEDKYRERLEQIKLQKKDNLKKLKAVERCLGRDGSLLEAELEFRIPIGDMEDLDKIERDEVPKNPYRVPESVAMLELVADEVVETAEVATELTTENEAVAETDVTADDKAVDVSMENLDGIADVYEDKTEKSDEVDTIISGVGMMEVRTDELEISVINAEPDLVQNDIQEHEEIKLPSNKVEYMGMSVAEKVRCYPFDAKGTETAFDMVKAYFADVGLDTSFHSVYEEAKLLTDYYEKEKAEEFIRERTERIIETIELMGADADKIAEYSPDVLSEVFDFGNIEYFAGIKLFNRVIDRLEVDMDQHRRYEVFDRIYEEGMREKKQEYNDRKR